MRREAWMGGATFLLWGALGCGGDQAPVVVAPSPAALVAAPARPAVDASSSATTDASAPAGAEPTVRDAGVASFDAGPPPKVTRTGKVWPFHPWTRAEAFTYNEMPLRAGVPLLVVNERGWSPHIAARKATTLAQAQKAVELVVATEGSVDVSKCPFPRHAVVLFDADVPVASVNVCFECGDIRVWPPFAAEKDWDKLSERERAALEKRYARQAKLYERAFPQWQALFRDELGFSVDKKYGASSE